MLGLGLIPGRGGTVLGGPREKKAAPSDRCLFHSGRMMTGAGSGRMCDEWWIHGESQRETDRSAAAAAERHIHRWREERAGKDPHAALRLLLVLVVHCSREKVCEPGTRSLDTKTNESSIPQFFFFSFFFPSAPRETAVQQQVLRESRNKVSGPSHP